MEDWKKILEAIDASREFMKVRAPIIERDLMLARQVISEVIKRREHPDKAQCLHVAALLYEAADAIEGDGLLSLSVEVTCGAFAAEDIAYSQAGGKLVR